MGDVEELEPQAQPERERPARTARETSPAIGLASAVGNRAMARMIAGSRTSAPGSHLARAPVQVTKALREERKPGMPAISWTAAYEVEFLPSGCWLQVNAKIVPDPGVTEAQVEAVKTQTATEFRRIWDRRFELTEKGTTNRYLVHVTIRYVESGEHVEIKLHPGSGHDNRRNWFVNSSATDRAHEVGHQIGQLDEYVDPDVVDRATATSPGVHTDNSIMGDYPNEGPAKAEAKARHGRALADQIGAATGKSYDVRTIPVADRDAADAAIQRARERVKAGVAGWFD